MNKIDTPLFSILSQIVQKWCKQVIFDDSSQNVHTYMEDTRIHTLKHSLTNSHIMVYFRWDSDKWNITVESDFFWWFGVSMALPAKPTNKTTHTVNGFTLIWDHQQRVGAPLCLVAITTWWNRTCSYGVGCSYCGGPRNIRCDAQQDCQPTGCRLILVLLYRWVLLVWLSV